MPAGSQLNWDVYIYRYLEPRFSPSTLQVPAGLNLIERPQYADNRARLIEQADVFRNVIEIIIETIGEE